MASNRHQLLTTLLLWLMAVTALLPCASAQSNGSDESHSLTAMSSEQLLEQGRRHFEQRQPGKALLCFTTICERYDEQMDSVSKQICIRAMNNRACVYKYYYYDYPQAYEYFTQAYELCEREGFDDFLPVIMVNLGDLLSDYNKRMQDSGDDSKTINYTDIVGALMSSVTTIINIISYVLIAFVSISLVVSSIMIGVITFISVLERRKEIGILRAIGASKKNISSVFNAETFFIGLLAGLLGVIITRLLLIPGNAIIHHLTNSVDINAFLPLAAAVILVILSVILTMIGGLIPSKKAARSDPVEALRTE